MMFPSDDVVTGVVPLQSSEKRFTDTKAVRICNTIRPICRNDMM